jgi:hypothetical protein
MNRRLYFLIPDKSHALSVVLELSSHGVDLDHIHTLANKKVRLQGLPNAEHQNRDLGHRIEDLLWKGNLAMFCLALVSLLILPLIIGLTAWLLLPVGIMLATFIGGLLFSRVPNTHLDEFRDALAHGKILLMADVPQKSVADIENRVHHHHPEATVGGVGWESEVFGF